MKLDDMLRDLRLRFDRHAVGQSLDRASYPIRTLWSYFEEDLQAALEAAYASGWKDGKAEPRGESP